jgi:hypothetical protein
MTITVKLGTEQRRWFDGILFDMDTADVRTLTIDYSGEIGSDTVASVTTTDQDITAGTPVFSSNVVTTSLSSPTEGAISYTDILMTTTAGDKISTKVRFRGVDR